MTRPFMTARWINLGIVTFAVPPRLLAPRIPRGLELDILDGDAFVSLVAFDFRDTRVLGIRWPGYVSFPELNLRTYVRRGSERGVVFLRELVRLRLVSWIARTFFNENYRSAFFSSFSREDSDTLAMEWQLEGRRRSHRLTITGRKPLFLPAAGSLEHYFTELRWGFGSDRRGQTVRYEVRHPPWEIYPVHSCSIDLDWGEVYGPEWSFLDQEQPCCTVLAAGSEVLVYPRAERNGKVERPSAARGLGTASSNELHPTRNGTAPGIAVPLHENRSGRTARMRPQES